MNRNFDPIGIGGFKYPVAPKVAGIASLGFLGALGFIPGWQPLFGCTGFLGFIGLAYIVEAVHRVLHRSI